MKIKEEVKQGSVILKEEPFVYILTSKHHTEYCDHCFKKGDFQKCSGCQYVHYCNRMCQRQGWSIHKHECNGLKKIGSRLLPDAARFLSRLIWILQKGGDKTQAFYTKAHFRTYKDLMSHYPNIKNDKQRLEHFTSLCAVLKEFLGEELFPNSAELMGMYGRMCINSFSITDQELQTIGTGIYLGASIIDHSCKPNAVAVFEGVTLHIRALENLPYLDWSKIFISYIDLMNPTAERQAELEQMYYFLCNCPKCLEPEPTEMIMGAVCPNSECDNAIDINNLGLARTCVKCGTEISTKMIKDFNEVMEFTDAKLQDMKYLAYLDTCQLCLKMQKGLFYKLNIKYIKTLDMAFESSISFNQFHDAKLYGLALIEGYYYWYGKYHPLTGLLHFKIGKIYLYHNNLDRGMEHLIRAYDILKMTHGINSPLVQYDLMPLLHQTKSDMSQHSK